MIRTAFFIIYALCISLATHSQALIINELMSDNETTLQDIDGEYSDWIELYNSGNEEIGLANFYLSDDKNNLNKWNFPDFTIKPQEYLVIFASGKDISTGDEWHTNFKISSEGEKIYLSDYQGETIDFLPKFELGNDQTIGRNPLLEKVILDLPTPGTKNISYSNFIDVSHSSGSYDVAFSLSINGESMDSIYYTTDGQDPTSAHSLYSEPIQIRSKANEPLKYALIPTTPPQGDISYKAWSTPASTPPQLNIIKYQSFKDGLPSSPLYTKVYCIGQQFTDLFDLPVMSLVADSTQLFGDEIGILVTGSNFDSERPAWTGNYFEKGHQWERPVSIDYFEDDAHVLSTRAGMRVHGNFTRHGAQKSLKILARKKFGSDIIDYPFITSSEKDHYHSFIVRTLMGSWHGKNLIKDEMLQEICKDLDFESLNYRPILVYLNGEFWGIYHLRDNRDEKHLSQISGLHADSLEIWNWYNSHYYTMIAYVEGNDLQEEEHYREVERRIDISSFIDYQIAEVFFQNKDWPGNNNSFWRPISEEGKWRWIFYDLDGTMPKTYVNILEKSIESEQSNKSSNLFRNLLESPIFKERFLNRYFELLETDFSTENMLIHFKNLQQPIRKHVDLQINRWGLPKSREDWQNDLDYVEYYLFQRPCLAKEELVKYFELDSALLCKQEPEEDLYNLFPNPAQSVLNISRARPAASSTTIQMHDRLGRLVYSDKVAELFRYRMDLSSFSQGLYLVTLIEEGELSAHKIVVQP